MSDQLEIPGQPTPEQLASYLDGELAEPERVWVEHWLRQHPAMALDLEQMSQLVYLCEQARPPEPSAAAWRAALHGIEQGLARPPRPPRRYAGRGLARMAAMAAAILLMVSAVTLLMRGRGTAPPEGPQQVSLPAPLLEEPFPVADASEIVIISMNPNDGEAVVIGQPLELEQLHLATHEEIQVIAKADPEVKIEEWATPMIVDPLALAGSRDP